MNSVQSTVFSNTQACPMVLPYKTATLALPNLPSIADNVVECWITVSMQLQKPTSWAESDHELAWCQNSLFRREPPLISPSLNHDFQVQEFKNTYLITSTNFTIEFDRIFGCMSNWKIHNLPTFTSPPTLAAWRPPTENDLKEDAARWDDFFLGNLEQQIISVSLQPSNESSVKITVQAYIGAVVRDWGFETNITYTIFRDGTVVLAHHIRPRGFYPKILPRIGLDMTLPAQLTSVTWFGCGPEESYSDKRHSQKVGVYHRTPDTLHTSYEFPQENGNRAGTRWLQITDDKGIGFQVTKLGGEEFDFNAQHYTGRDLADAKHPTDLRRREEVFLRLDDMHAGLGTARCGPATLEKYRVPCVEREFGFVFKPAVL
jgi:beta-galactosidase